MSSVTTSPVQENRDDPAMPYQSLWWFNMFRWYSRRYIRKHFHAMRISKSSHPLPKGDGESLLFVTNHPSWWDILACFVICERYQHYRHFAPIEAEMLEKYKMFTKMGFFGVEPTPRGAAKFLRTTQAIFSKPFRSMWITAQGKFVDARVRPIELKPGIGYVASKLNQGLLIPVAIEYPFWDEKTPEILMRFGEPFDLSIHRDWSKETWTSAIEKNLEATMDILAQEAITRDAKLFDIIVSGKVGVGGIYDWWRGFKSWFTGKKFDPAHMGSESKS